MEPLAFKQLLEKHGFKPVSGVPVLYKKGDTMPFFTANLMASPAIIGQKAIGSPVETFPVTSEQDILNALVTYDNAPSPESQA